MNLRKQKELVSRALGASKKRIKFNITNDNKKRSQRVNFKRRC